MTSKYWESYMIVLPPGEDADQLQEFLKAQLGFDDTDWCEMTRPDAARVLWGPCKPLQPEGWISCPRGCGSLLRADVDMETTSHVCPTVGTRRFNPNVCA